tara:strand:+ start:369 stop:551 length:183 start_codon:yes stop_codon:yes gene_type:complete
MSLPFLVANRLNKQYSIYPISLLGLKPNLNNIKLLGNGVVWVNNNAYIIDKDSNGIRAFE